MPKRVLNTFKLSGRIVRYKCVDCNEWHDHIVLIAMPKKPERCDDCKRKRTRMLSYAAAKRRKLVSRRKRNETLDCIGISTDSTDSTGLMKGKVTIR